MMQQVAQAERICYAHPRSVDCLHTLQSGIYGAYQWVFFARDSEDSEFESVTPTDFSMYEPDDLEHVGWYYIPVQNKQATWMEPYLNSNINVYMISYVVPIYVNDESVGIIGMDIDFRAFTDVLDASNIFKTGYAFMANEQGKIMYHKELETGSSITDAGEGLEQGLDF